MEDQKTVKKNTVVDLPRDPEGKLIIEQIATGKDEKNNYIIPDDIFDEVYKELPPGTSNESKTYKAYNNGKIKTLTSNDTDIQKLGGEALQAKLRQRRKIQETVQLMLAKKANKEDIERYQLETGATQQDVLVAAMLEKAIEGKDVQAFNSLRDTAGEKPATEVNATIEEITPEDKELLQRVNARLNSNT